MASPAADSRKSSLYDFVHDPSDDSCSICLEPFSDNDPATVTSCKHEYHLQCILEWSQRSKDCPMCWQSLSLKDPNSQELLDAVERERSIRQSMQIPSVFQRTPGDEFEFHVPAYAGDSEFEERIMQHLAAAAMGRAHHLARRENLRNRPSSGRRHPQFVVVPTLSSPTSLPSNTSGGSLPAPAALGSVSSPVLTSPEDPYVQQSFSVGRTAAAFNRPSGTTNFVRAGELNRTEAHSLRQRSGLEPVQENQQRTVPLEMHSFSESLKSRFAAASSRYKESFTKATNSFRERLRARTNMTDLERLRACTNMADLGSRAREVSAGVVRALERISLESTGRSRGDTSIPTVSDETSDMGGCLTPLTDASSVDEPEGNGDGSSVNANDNDPRNRVATQPPIDETDSEFDGALSKDFEGSSVGGVAGVDHVTVLPSVA